MFTNVYHTCLDDELKRRMLECDEPTPQLLEEIVQRYERVQADTSAPESQPEQLPSAAAKTNSAE